jgi:hypothetical protein
LLVTFRVTVTVLVTPPPVAVSVSLKAPTLAVDALVRVKVLAPLPGAAMVCGLKLAVTPLGAPDTDTASAALNPPVAREVSVTVAFPPGRSDTVLALAVRVKPGTLTVILAV